MQNFKGLREFVWPIRASETRKFLCMSMMLFFSLFNYNALRTLKDAFVVPNIGAEAISFIKVFGVLPASIIFVLIYIKMTDNLSFRKIYTYVASFFVCFFLLFGFALYPNELLIHPDISIQESLMVKNFNLGVFQIHGSHFKWFYLVYNKWLYAVFYVVAELWSVMYALLFWQFANQITTTNEAKRFYPMFAFMGSFGTFTVGTLIKVIFIIKDSLYQMQLIMVMLALSGVAIIFLFEYMIRNIVKESDEIKTINKSKIQAEMGLVKSLRTIFSSKYLGYITILVVSYGVTLNLMEGPWKASVKELFNNTGDYMYFMADVNQWMGSVSMLFILIGAHILKKYSWLFAAQITPVVFLVTGVAFFLFLIFKSQVHIYLGSFIIFDPMIIAVYVGMSQVVVGKSTKYALFDPTKEMAYIPINPQLKSKGKAAVDIIGARISRSGASLLQAMIFIVFPASTYLTISDVLMSIFVFMTVIWIISVRLLNKSYLQAIKKDND
jgi:ATP:ADP antiporter, AAA family